MSDATSVRGTRGRGTRRGRGRGWSCGGWRRWRCRWAETSSDSCWFRFFSCAVIIPRMIFIMLSSWPQGHCERSPGSFDECRTAPSGRQPLDQATWLGLSPLVGCCRQQPQLSFINIQLENLYSFTIPWWVEGWVDLGTAGRVHTAHAQGCKSQWFLR